MDTYYQYYSYYYYFSFSSFSLFSAFFFLLLHLLFLFGGNMVIGYYTGPQFSIRLVSLRERYLTLNFFIVLSFQKSSPSPGLFYVFLTFHFGLGTVSRHSFGSVDLPVHIRKVECRSRLRSQWTVSRCLFGNSIQLDVGGGLTLVTSLGFGSWRVDSGLDTLCIKCCYYLPTTLLFP